MKKAWNWLQGKKTILAGLIICLGGVAGCAVGKLPATSAVVVIGVGLGMAGWGDKSNRHHAEILAALDAVAKAGADYRAGKPQAAIQVMEVTAEQLAAAGLAMNATGKVQQG